MITATCLRQAFDLSPTEADIVLALLDGLRAKDIAATRNVSIATVRSQIKSIYAKTETRGQAHLMRLVKGKDDSRQA